MLLKDVVAKGHFLQFGCKKALWRLTGDGSDDALPGAPEMLSTSRDSTRNSYRCMQACLPHCDAVVPVDHLPRAEASTT